MTTSLARRERAALCDLALAVGEDAPTLCDGWDARDLIAHLLVRERNPIASAGNVVGPLSGLTDKAMARERERPYAALVDRLREPALLLRTIPGLDGAMNTFEMLVHHEDLRRGQADWEPRDLSPEDADQIWSQLGRAGRLLGRKLPAPTVARRAGTDETAVLRKGEDPVVITGEPVELVLFVFGRPATHDLTFDGPDATVAAVRSADLGV